MSILRNTLEYLTGVDLIRSANRHAAIVGEFELDKDQIYKDRSGFQKHTLIAFIVNQAINVAEVLNIGSMVANSYDSLVKMHRSYDELTSVAVPYLLYSLLIECARFISRKSVLLKEDAENKNY